MVKVYQVQLDSMFAGILLLLSLLVRDARTSLICFLLLLSTVRISIHVLRQTALPRLLVSSQL